MRCAKRAIDILLSGTGLILLSPLCVAIGVLIVLEDGPPVFFSHLYYGKGARAFRQYKFRSMRENSRAIRRDDERVTSVGRIIRATALDEIPQLWNILKGDMSIVGPRPVAVDELERREDNYYSLFTVPNFIERCKVRPGLTGFAQLYLPKYISLNERFQYDALYVKDWSLWLDVRFFMASVIHTLKGRWERDKRDHTLEVKWP